MKNSTRQQINYLLSCNDEFDYTYNSFKDCTHDFIDKFGTCEYCYENINTTKRLSRISLSSIIENTHKEKK